MYIYIDIDIDIDIDMYVDIHVFPIFTFISKHVPRLYQLAPMRLARPAKAKALGVAGALARHSEHQEQ